MLRTLPLFPALVIIAGCAAPEVPVPPPASGMVMSESLPATQPPEPPAATQPVNPLAAQSRPAAERQQEILHALRRYPKQHDAYLHLDDIADASSIDVLMLRLCADYPEPKGPPPPGGQRGYDCAQVHLTDVLRSVTNQDPGMGCSDWQRWLRRNKMKTWTEWIADGFAYDGVDVARPSTERAFRALVVYMADDRKWRRINAWRILSALPAEDLKRQLDALRNDQDRVVRLGVERVRAKLAGAQ